MGSSTSSARSHHTHDPGCAAEADNPCHVHSCTDPVRSHDGGWEGALRTRLPDTDGVEGGSLPAVHACYAEEIDSEIHSSPDEESGHGSRDAEGCNRGVGHDRTHLRREGSHGGLEGSENGQSVHVDARLESVLVRSFESRLNGCELTSDTQETRAPLNSRSFSFSTAVLRSAAVSNSTKLYKSVRISLLNHFILNSPFTIPFSTGL